MVHLCLPTCNFWETLTQTLFQPAVTQANCQFSAWLLYHTVVLSKKPNHQQVWHTAGLVCLSCFYNAQTSRYTAKSMYAFSNRHLTCTEHTFPTISLQKQCSGHALQISCPWQGSLSNVYSLCRHQFCTLQIQFTLLPPPSQVWAPKKSETW